MGKQESENEMEIMVSYEKKGYEIGYEIGYKIGFEIGEKKIITQIAERMLEKNIDPGTIAEVTGLSTEDISRLKK